MPTRPPVHKPLGWQGAQRAKLEERRRYDRGRQADHGFYNSSAWRRVRALVLTRDHYLCQCCKRAGRTTTANVVDHVVARKDAPDRALDETNLEASCKSCNDRKRAATEGGFGNKRT